MRAYRNRRIVQVLSKDSLITVRDMEKLQNDNFNMMASESLPLFLDMMNTDSLTSDGEEALRLLRSWNYFNDANSKAAVYYEAWWQAFYRMVWDEMDRPGVSLERPTEYVTIKFLRNEPDFKFFDIQGTPEKETAKDIVNKTFAQAITTVESWEKEHPNEEVAWGSYKNTVIQHLARLQPFNRYVNTGGNESIVNATRKRNGPSWRQVISLEPSGIKAYGAYPGGQSGNPGSPYYDNLLRYWVTGTYFQLSFTNEDSLKEQALFMSDYNPD